MYRQNMKNIRDMLWNSLEDEAKKKRKKDPRTMALDYHVGYKIVTLNCRGMNEKTKRELIIKHMKNLDIEVLCLQETHININCKEEKDGYTFLFSSGVTDKARDEWEKHKNTPKGRGKGKMTGKQKVKMQHAAMEKAGVGIVFSPHIRRCLTDFEQIDGRQMYIKLKSHSNPVTILNTYAPQSKLGDNVEERQKVKDDHYQQLTKTSEQIPEAEALFIFGDMNAKLQVRLPEETSIIGKHVFGKGMAGLENANDDTLDNRFRMMDFCQEQGLVVMNTMFEKEKKKQVTRKELTTEGWKGPWSEDRYSQMDFCLARSRWKNSVVDVSSKPELAFNSDHCLVISTIKIRLKRQPTETNEPIIRYRNPTKQQKHEYNRRLSLNETWYEDQTIDLDERMRGLMEDMLNRAAENFTPIPPKQKQSYLTEKTWNLITKRQEAHEKGNEEECTKLSKQIRKAADKDKFEFQKSEFEKGATQKEKWEGIKTAKKNYTPTFTKMKDIRGNRVLPDKQADAKAEYLAEIQWKKPEATAKKTNPRKIITHNLHITENEITIRELKAMIKRLKKNKAPGPDKVTVELFKLLNIKNQKSSWTC